MMLMLMSDIILLDAADDARSAMIISMMSAMLMIRLCLPMPDIAARHVLFAKD